MSHSQEKNDQDGYRLMVEFTSLDLSQKEPRPVTTKRFGVVVRDQKFDLDHLACVVNTSKKDLKIKITDHEVTIEEGANFHVISCKEDSEDQPKQTPKNWDAINLYKFRPYKQQRVKQERWLLQFRGHIYILEGNIGSGKSTLGRIMESFTKNRNQPCIFMPERFPEETLKKFILFADEHPGKANPWAYPLQRDILQLRLQTYIDALEWSRKGYIVFIDRSLPGDYVFALLNYVLGNITEKDWQEYCSTLESVDMLEPTAIIFLDTAVPACISRIGKRSRDAEKKYKPEYLASVDDTYKRVLPTLGYPMITIPWSEERQVEDLLVCNTIATSIYKGLEQLLHADCDSNHMRIIV